MNTCRRSTVASLVLSIFLACFFISNAALVWAAENPDTISLTIWAPSHNDPENELIKKLCEEYTRNSNGKVTVTVEIIPKGSSFGYEDKISAAVTSKTLPDIIMLDGPNMTNYAYSGIIVPIDEGFSKEELADFVPSVIDQGTYDGKLYCLSPSESSVAVFYNKKIIEQAGLKPPTELEDAWTWDQFLEAVKKVHQEGQVRGLSIHPEYGTGEWMTYMPLPFIWSNKAEALSEDGMKAGGVLNSDGTVEAMTYFQQLAKYANWQATPTEFEEGKAAFSISGAWCIPGLKNVPGFEWGLTFLPYNKAQSSPCGDWSWAVTKQCKHVEAARDVIKYITNTESVVRWSRASGKPASRKSSFDQMKEWDEYPLSILKQQVVNTAKARPKTPAYPAFSQEFAAAAIDIVLGTDVKARLDKAAAKIDKNIKRNFQ